MSGAGRDAKGGNLLQRVISAIVLAVIVLAATIIGGLAFGLLIAAMSLAVFQEWMAMHASPGRVQEILGWAGLGIVLLSLLSGLAAPLVLAVMGAVVIIVLGHGIVTDKGLWTAGGIAYTGLPALALVGLRESEAGLTVVIFLFAVVWATDVAAYFVGRSIGGPRLAPAISPAKTWSGAIGGAVGGLFAGFAVFWFLDPSHATWNAALAAIGLSAVSQIGDLFESALKRRCGIKDSGALIPGHGGVMDRVDGLVAAAVLFYVMSA